MRSMKTRSGGEPPPGGLPYGMTSLGGPVPAARGAQGEPDAQAEPTALTEPAALAESDADQAAQAAQAESGDDQAAQAAQAAQAEPEAGQALAALYEAHYRSLVQLAALLIADLATAEEIVQDSFAAVHGMRHVLPDTDAALGYLRRAVVHRSRKAARPEPGEAADPQAGLALQGSAVVSALRALPVRQREVLVLRYFADLPEAEIASATGISAAAVRTHAARAMSALHAELRPAGLGEAGPDQAPG